jgi:sensor histidine kinase regulating citrate/malate metabolism
MPDERERVWDWALRAIATPTRSPSEFNLANDMAAIADCEPIHDGNAVVGAIIRLRVKQ